MTVIVVKFVNLTNDQVCILLVSKRKQEPPLPQLFDPPVNFSPQVMAGLEAENLVGNARTKFITAIVNAIFRYKSYPTDEEYHHVAQQVVRKWKFLDTFRK